MLDNTFVFTWILHDKKIHMILTTKRFAKLRVNSHLRKDASAGFLSDVRRSLSFHLTPLSIFLVLSYLALFPSPSFNLPLLLVYEIENRRESSASSRSNPWYYSHLQYQRVVFIPFQTCVKYVHSLYFFVILFNLLIKVFTKVWFIHFI